MKRRREWGQEGEVTGARSGGMGCLRALKHRAEVQVWGTGWLRAQESQGWGSRSEGIDRKSVV